MLTLQGATILVLAAGLPWVRSGDAGENILEAPQNVKVSIVDDNFTLNWHSTESVRNVTFSAEYQIPEVKANWSKLPGCQYVTGTTCDFSSLKLNVFEEINLRIRAEKGNTTSPWCKVYSFVPFQKAQLGPPEVRLKAEDKAILIFISPPGSKDSVMWAMDHPLFVYNVVIWKNSSNTQEMTHTIHSRDKIYKLSPETTYCLKVRARLRLQRKVGFYSPVYCINTTVENKLPPPENVRLDTENQVYVLKWDYLHENVTFQAQWLHAYLKKVPGSYADQWRQIPGCGHIRATRCLFAQHALPKGIHFVRVQASSGNTTSSWSEEKQIDTETQIVLFPPVLKVKPVSQDSLRVYIHNSEDSLDALLDLYHIYEVVFWENSSDTKSTLLEKDDFTVHHLKALTIYCVKARVHVKEEIWNKSSVFSDVVCERTKPGNPSKGVAFEILVPLVSVTVIICLVFILRKVIKYVFFPSSKPPSAINECLSEQPGRNLLLFTSEEQTEKCFVIENSNTVAKVEEIIQIDEDYKKYTSQTSEDSGNYSNEDDHNGSKSGDDFL